MREKNAVIIFAKSPRIEDVKTRLAGRLSAGERLGLYRSLLEDTVEKLRRVPGADTFISYTPPEDGDYFEGFGLRTFPQAEGDLGLKMHAALARVLGEGYEKAILVGVDIPGLSSAVTERAFVLLEGSDVVFGPATDGGYYLVGLKRPEEAVFTGVEWSTVTTLTESVAKAEAAGLRVGYADTLSDIDRPEDLKGHLPG
ncbi:MAG: TIGR04282 family arsenosugar biosynthesis glycosyltransferase [Nitrospirota bacterium]